VRNDGFHISEDVAWPVRSLTALQALNSVWRGAAGINTIDPGLFSLRSSATPAASAAPAPTVSAPSGYAPAPISSVKGVVFGLVDASAGLSGVYVFDPTGGQLTRLEGAGFNLQAVSPDGQKLLLNYGPELYLLRLDGSPPQLISNSFNDLGLQHAAWLPDGSRLVLLDRRDGQDALWLVDETRSAEGAGWQRLTPPDRAAAAVYPGPDAGRVYWGEVTCLADKACGTGRVFSSALDGSPPQELAGVRRPVFAPGGAYFAYTKADANTQEMSTRDKSSIFVARLDRKVDRRIELGGSGSDFRVMDYTWSPDGKQLAVQVVARDSYTGHLEDTRTVIITPANWGTRELPFSAGQATQVTWSLDSGRVLLTSTIQDGSVYRIAAQLFDLASGKTSVLDDPRRAEGDKINLSGSGFVSLTNIFWLP
jgi:WD40 repeat protein